MNSYRMAITKGARNVDLEIQISLGVVEQNYNALRIMMSGAKVLFDDKIKRIERRNDIKKGLYNSA